MTVVVVDESMSNAKTSSTFAAAASHDTVDGGESSDGCADKERVPSHSVGSSLHGTGECKPCAWFWKPQGCQNGKECMHCHLCPLNAIKDRKKLHAAVRKELAKVPQRVEPSGNLEAESKAGKNEKDIEQAQFADPNELRLRGKPSKGSALHGTGECKPCAWFWHPKGCQSHEECEFCHFCPLGELKLRRKLKVQQMKCGSVEGSVESLSAPKYVTLQAAKPAPDELSLDIKMPSDTGTPEVLNDARPQAKAEVSVGSDSHGTGECKPCAWFWKPEGCKNGKGCLYCHLCPQGERERKKKEKHAKLARESIREQLAFQNEIIQQQQQHLANLQFQMLMQQMMWASGAMNISMGMDFGQYNDFDGDDDEEEDETLPS